MSKLEPCPFEHEVKAGLTVTTIGSGIMVECWDCSSEGPFALTESKAIAVWNRRTSVHEAERLRGLLESFQRVQWHFLRRRVDKAVSLDRGHRCVWRDQLEAAAQSAQAEALDTKESE